MAKLGSAVVFITGDTKGLNDALGRSQVVARQSFGNISAAATAAGRKMAVMGAAMTAAFGSMVKTAADFDLAMIESTSIMGDLADSTKQQMRDLALEMSKESKFAANELAKSYYFLAAAGLDAEQSMGALRMVMEFATAGAFDLSRATDLLTDAQSALGMSSKDTSENMKNMQRVSDVLIRANTLANASAQQFSESLTNKAGAALKIVNKDIEEGVAVLAAFADQGIKGAEAGSALGIVMRDLQTKFISATKEGPEQLVEKYQRLAAQLAIAQQKFREMQASGKASESSLMAQAEKVRLLQDQMVSLKDGMENGSKAVNKFGVTVFDAQGNMRNMGDIVADLENALAGMSDEQAKATLLQMGFTDKSVGFIQVLMGTSEKIRDYEKALYEAGGTTKQVSDSQMEAFSNKMLKVGHQIQAVAIEVGTNLMPTIEQFVNESIIPAIRAVGAWVQENKNLIPLLAKVGVALAVGGPILTGLGQGVLLFGKMNAALKVLGPALTSTITCRRWGAPSTGSPTSMSRGSTC